MIWTLFQFQSSQSPEMNLIVLKKATTTEFFKALDENIEMSVKEWQKKNALKVHYNI